ncbi:MAG TPA: hypothetical protein ENJ50_09170, partial [Planctomycetaceae bacterium]|nr:hypothetical protein [Planctomycetaceae bacterium]
MIDPGRDIAGAATGLPLLRYLNLDGNPLPELFQIDELHRLRVLSVNDTIESTQPGWQSEFVIAEEGQSFTTVPDFSLYPVSLGTTTRIDFDNSGDFPNFEVPGALYTTGIVSITGGVATLSGGTWPDWAADGELTITQNDTPVTYSVTTRDSDTQLTLDDPAASGGGHFQLGRSFAARWTGQLFVPYGAQRTFTLASGTSDGSCLSVDGRVVADDGCPTHSANAGGTVYLEPGFHDIQVDYFHTTGFAKVQVQYDPIPGLLLDLPARLMTTPAVSDLTAVGRLTNLAYVSLENNAITNADPLGDLPDARIVDLSGNSIASIAGLSGIQSIDDAWEPDGFRQTGQRWSRSLSHVEDAFRGDYRYQFDDGEDGEAIWTFDGLLPGTYDVYATWHADEDQASNAAYTVISDNESSLVVVDQRLAAEDRIAAGRPWKKLMDAVPVSEAGELSVQLTSAGADGTVIADGILVVATTSRLPSLERLDLRDNPLNNDTVELGIPLIGEGRVDHDANAAPVLTSRLPSQAHSSGPNAPPLTPLTVLDYIDDKNASWMMIGLAHSSELLRYGLPETGSGAEFQGTMAQVKVPEATGTHRLSGAVQRADGTVFVTDADGNAVHWVNPSTGRILATSTLGASGNTDQLLTPRDIVSAPDGSYEYVASLNRHSLERFFGRYDSVTGVPEVKSASTYASLPVMADDYSLANGVGDNILVSWQGMVGGVRRGEVLVVAGADQVSPLITPGIDPELHVPLDVATGPEGDIYVVDLAADEQSYRVLHYSASASFVHVVVSDRPIAFDSRDSRPRIEIGPDQLLYLSDP